MLHEQKKHIIVMSEGSSMCLLLGVLKIREITTLQCVIFRISVSQLFFIISD